MKTFTIRDFQNRVEEIWGKPNGQFYSADDLLTQNIRFTLRTLKGIRKGDKKRVETNMWISLSWLTSLANRFHIDIEDALWRRFPAQCPYCGHNPCTCPQNNKPTTKKNLNTKGRTRPQSIDEWQKMFQKIYPQTSRTLVDAGIHLAEESGEVSEAAGNFMGTHAKRQFESIGDEIADYLANFFAVANAAKIIASKGLDAHTKNGCTTCHKTPCTCTFQTVLGFIS